MPLSKNITPMLTVVVDVASDFTTEYSAHCSTPPLVRSRLVKSAALPVPSVLTAPDALMLQRKPLLLAEKLAPVSITNSTCGAADGSGGGTANRSVSAACAPRLVASAAAAIHAAN